MSALYSPLDVTRREIRLVRLVPETIPIALELTVVALDDKPMYTALSYCWGKARGSSTITVNSQKFSVRPNLYAYLKIMADEHEAHWIFVDSICINQDDISERGNQVALMGELYKQATMVIAWLGTPEVATSWDHTSAQGLFDDLRESVDRERDTKELDRFVARSVEHATHEDFEERLGGQLERYGLEKVYALVRTLVCRPYWSRVWIVQEAVLGRVLELKYGKTHISWNAFAILVTLLMSPDTPEMSSQRPLGCRSRYLTLSMFKRPIPGVRDTSHAMDLVSNIFMMRNLSSNGLPGFTGLVRTDNLPPDQHPLGRLMCDFGDQQCSVSYDKIYGILGLTSSSLRPDYAMSLTELFLRSLLESLMDLAPKHYDNREHSHNLWAAAENIRERLTAGLGKSMWHAPFYFLAAEAHRRFALPDPDDSWLWHSARYEMALSYDHKRRAVASFKDVPGLFGSMLALRFTLFRKLSHFTMARLEALQDRQSLLRLFDSVYADLLESRHQGISKLRSIVNGLPHFNMCENAQKNPLLDWIATFPTPAEASVVILAAIKHLIHALAHTYANKPEVRTRTSAVIAYLCHVWLRRALYHIQPAAKETVESIYQSVWPRDRYGEMSYVMLIRMEDELAPGFKGHDQEEIVEHSASLRGGQCHMQ